MSAPAIARDQWPEVVRLYHDERLSLTDLAERYRASRETLRLVLKAAGAPARRRADAMRAYAAARPAAPAPAQPPGNREQRALDYAAQLAAEGWAAEDATARARAAYGLGPDRRPAAELRLSQAWRHQMREQFATSRPGVESGTRSEASYQRQRRAAANGARR